MPALLLLLQEAAPGGGEAEPFSPFSINTGMAFWTILIFLILLALLWKLGWPTILASVEERERRIQQQLDQAETARAEAARLLEEQKQLLAAARTEGVEIVARAKSMALQEREGLIAKAHEEQEQLLARARREIAAETSKAIEAVRREAVDLSLAAASQLIEANLDSVANRRLVTQYIDHLAEDETSAPKATG
jgi:F-type H+-transporting ATPase subunit b